MAKYEEDNLQGGCVKWYNFTHSKHGIIHHSPNGFFASSPTQAKRFFDKLGTKRGFPDLFIAVPNRLYHGLFVELKTAKGKVSSFQEMTMEKLEKSGYYCQVIRSHKDFVTLVNNYIADVKK